MNEKWIEISSLDLNYGSKAIVKGLNLFINNGITLIIGQNGTGKSTLYSAIEGLKAVPKNSKITIDGISPDVNPVEFMVNTSFLPERPIQLSRGKVYSWVEEYSALKPFSFQLFSTLLETFDIQYILNLPGESLSMGERQLISLCLCLASDARGYVLDEPNANLDSEKRILLSDIMEEMKKKRNASFLITSHMIDEILPVTDDILIFSKESGITGPFKLKEGLEHVHIRFRSTETDRMDRMLKGSGMTYKLETRTFIVENQSVWSLISAMGSELANTLTAFQISPNTIGG